MERAQHGGVAQALCRDLTAASDAEEVADRAVAVWLAISAALAPIIGVRGVAALYSRSIHLTVTEHPWLAELHAAPSSAMDLAALRGTLARCDGRDGTAACVALVSNFCDTLASLVGESLAERLLSSPALSPTDTGMSRDRTP